MRLGKRVRSRADPEEDQAHNGIVSENKPRVMQSSTEPLLQWTPMLLCQTKASDISANLTRATQNYDRFSLSKIALARTAELKGVFKIRGPRL